jgi:hypothetical protein
MDRKRVFIACDVSDGVCKKKFRKSFAAEPTLARMADELIHAVLSFMDFRERSISRGVCCRLKKIVDAMPPPGTSLEIRLFSGFPSSLANAITWHHIGSLVQVSADINLPGSQFPPLRTIRPARLHIETFSSIFGELGPPVDISRLRMLAADVGGTVTDLTVVNLQAHDLTELQESFSKFDDVGDSVRKLHLSTLFPLPRALSAATCLRDLERLSLVLTDEMLPDWREDALAVGDSLSELASLPNLRDLAIHRHFFQSIDGIDRDDAAAMSFALGCSHIRQLKRLTSCMLVDRGVMSQKGIATVFRRLVGLEQLSELTDPTYWLWREIGLMGGNKTLQKLAIRYYEAEVEDLKALVIGCTQSLPSLAELDINLMVFFIDHSDHNETIGALTGLKDHSSLRRVNITWERHMLCDEIYTESFSSDLQKALGKRITVNMMW